MFIQEQTAYDTRELSYKYQPNRTLRPRTVTHKFYRISQHLSVLKTVFGKLFISHGTPFVDIPESSNY